MDAKVDLYDSTYGHFEASVLARIREKTFGEDFGQNSWTTAEEYREWSRWLELREGSHVLEVASGSGGPAMFLAELSGARVTGIDINAHGVIVGTSAVDTVSRAFIWKDGVMRELDAFPGHYTRAVAINDQGRVLGVAGWPYKASRYDYYGPGDTVFVWDNGQAQIVTTTRIMGLWLRPNGTVIGNTDVEHEPRAFVWEAGVLTDLGPRSWVNGVNSHGDMVGRRGDMPMLWRKKGS